MKGKTLGVLAASLLVPASAGAQAPTIQPGDWAFTNAGGTDLPCTLAWVFDGSDGRTYFGSAAHCGPPGAEIHITDPAALQPTPTEVVGKVAYRGSDGADAAEDVALIRVRDELVGRVQGELRGHPGIPSGITPTADASPGDLLQFSGWGIGVQASAPTREQREGVYVEGSEYKWNGVVPVINGDSGGPVAHVATKGAFGINKGYGCGAGTDGSAFCGTHGASVASIERLAAKSGLKLTLRLSGAPAPAPQPPQQNQPPAEQPPATHEQPAAPATTVGVHVKRLSARTIKRSKRLRLEIAPSRPLENVSVLLTRGKRSFAVGTASATTGRAKLTLKARRAVKRGRYTIVVTARDDLGRAVRAASSVKVGR